MNVQTAAADRPEIAPGKLVLFGSGETLPSGQPILESSYIFMGPGSPTYMARQLTGTLALHYIVERHRQGAFLCMASAAALAIVPHWNNAEGGDELDTSRCFIGRARMDELRRQLPPSTRILGIDEHTAVIFDFEQTCCLVQGKGTVTTLSRAEECVYEAGGSFPFSELGSDWHPSASVKQERAAPPSTAQAELPPQVAELIEQREHARKERGWATADTLRRHKSPRAISRCCARQVSMIGPFWTSLRSRLTLLL